MFDELLEVAHLDHSSRDARQRSKRERTPTQSEDLPSFDDDPNGGRVHEPHMPEVNHQVGVVVGDGPTKSTRHRGDRGGVVLPASRTTVRESCCVRGGWPRLGSGGVWVSVMRPPASAVCEALPGSGASLGGQSEPADTTG